MSLSNFFGPNGSNSLCHLSWLEWYIRYLHCSFHNIYIPGSAKRLPPSFWMNWIVLGGWAPVVGRTFGEGWRGNQAGRSQRGPLFFRDDSVGWQNKPTILRPSFLGRNTLRFFMKNEGVVLFQSSLSSRFHKKMSCGILVLPYIVGGHSCSSTRLHAGEEEGFPVSSYKPAAARSGWWRCGIAVGTVVCSLCDKEEIVCMLSRMLAASSTMDVATVQTLLLETKMKSQAASMSRAKSSGTHVFHLISALPQGSLNGTHLRGGKQYKSMVSLRDFP